jgi:hypothetical protein
LRPTLVDGKQFVLAEAVSRTRHGAYRRGGHQPVARSLRNGDSEEEADKMLDRVTKDDGRCKQ